MSPGLLGGGEMLRPLGIKWKDLRRTVSQCEGKVAECNHVCGVHSSDYSTGRTNSAFVLALLKFRFWHVLFFHLLRSPVTPRMDSTLQKLPPNVFECIIYCLL